MRVLLVFFLMLSPAAAQDRSMILASTTSTQNSGLLDAILPEFEAATGIHVYVVAVGTGQAMRIAQNGDADAILVHHRPSEDLFVAKGYGVDRITIMSNDFVVIGPKSDPAGVLNAGKATQAFANILEHQTQFVSRGDLSGTHLKELEIWRDTGLQPDGRWYLEIGSGMGTALNLASGLGAYILSDRSTWLSFQNHGDLDLLFEGGTEMHNPYGYIRVNPARFPHVKSDESAELGIWLAGPGQAHIAAFKINNTQLFCPMLPAPNQNQNQNSRCAADNL